MDTLKAGSTNKKRYMDNPYPGKALVQPIVPLSECEQNSVAGKSIIKKGSGSASVISFDEGEGLDETISPFDTFVQIIDGTAEIVIDNKSNILKIGDAILIPAHTSSYIKPNARFKMLAIIGKSSD